VDALGDDVGTGLRGEREETADGEEGSTVDGDGDLRDGLDCGRWLLLGLKGLRVERREGEREQAEREGDEGTEAGAFAERGRERHAGFLP